MKANGPPPMTDRTKLNHARGKILSSKIYSWTLDVKKYFGVSGNDDQGGSQLGWGTIKGWEGPKTE